MCNASSQKLNTFTVEIDTKADTIFWFKKFYTYISICLGLTFSFFLKDVEHEADPEPEPIITEIQRLAERRASSLDHHWPVPKQKTHSDSLDSQPESDSMQLGETAGGVDDGDVPGNFTHCI